MPALNTKPVRLLMQDMVSELGITPGQTFTREQAVQWFARRYPNVKQGTVAAHLIRLSTNVRTRLQYSPRADGSDDRFYKIDSTHFRLYEPGRDPTPISDLSPEPGDEAPEDLPTASSAFAYEHDLRDYLAGNLHLLDPSLRLFSDEGITGVEFPVGGRFIDLLATDPRGYVVIELKVSRGYDRVVGQLLRYMSWIKKNHAEPGQAVRGIIVAKEITEDLLLACSELPNVSLYEYELSVSLKQIAVSGHAAAPPLGVAATADAAGPANPTPASR